MSLRSGAIPCALLGVIAFAAGCGKSTLTGPRTVTVLEITAGNNQSGPVGSTLVTVVSARARDAQGPIPGVVLSAATESQGGGSVAPASATTDASGLVQLQWTLGAKVGTQTLTVSAGSLKTVVANATGTPGLASTVFPASEPFQTSVVSRAVTIRPKVTVADAFGNPIPNVPVTFEAVQSSSVILGVSQVTDANGQATIGSWTIGPDAGNYDLRAGIANGAVAAFQALGIPAAVTAVAGNGQTANAGTSVPILPAVRAVRDDASPLPNVVVTFGVVSGGGQVDGATTTTGADGIARPARWVLGTTPGPNQIQAQTAGLAPIVLTANGIAAVASGTAAASASVFTGFFGNYVIGTPAIRVTDAVGNPVAGATVTFSATQGDPQLTGTTRLSDFQGVATLGSFRLGNAPNQAVEARSGVLPPVTFTATATAPPAGNFTIEIRYRSGTPTAAQKGAFDAAVARWTQLLLAGGGPYLVHEVDPSCPSINGETVPGLVIFADLIPIDGPGRILGQSGPCILRDIGFLPAEGLMQFDTADLATLEANNQLNPVILHEMGHVLGFGTIWNFAPLGLPANAFLTGFGGGDPFFNGAAAKAAFFGAITPGSTFTGTPVPVEASGGAGTAYSHWRESTFNNEIMTGFLNSGVNPLSAMTVEQFHDLGYLVNDAPAEPYSFFASLIASYGSPMQIVEGKLPGPIIVINKRGDEVARYPRL